MIFLTAFSGGLHSVATSGYSLATLAGCTFTKPAITPGGRRCVLGAQVVRGDTRDFRCFNLYSVTRSDLYLATGYGLGFLRKVSREEFFDWLAHTPNTDC